MFPITKGQEDLAERVRQMRVVCRGYESGGWMIEIER